jgi:predicted Zn-dependent protease
MVLPILFLALAACATNPATGKREISLVSESQEIQLGQQAKQDVLKSSAIVPDSALQRYVSGLGMAIARSSERPDLPWSFIVLDDPVVNAFALPGGPIFITRGILTHMTDEAELVSVLGHEAGHITARHSARQMTKAQLAQVGLIAGAIAAPQVVEQFGGLASTGLQLLFLKFSRGDETQADELGFRYMLNVNYDPREMADMFRTLQRVSGDEGGRIPEWQSTHPDPGNRVEATEARIAAANKPLTGLKVERDNFLRHTEGLVFGEDPRQGFFEGSTFHHPELRFRIDFPSGWKTHNGMASVDAMSAQQDAVMSLTLGGQGSPSQQLQQFLGQQGVQAGRTSTQSINGLQAAMGEFAANTEQGQVTGLVTYVALGSQAYQIIAYTPAQRASSYGQVFESAARSFRPETDQKVLSVKPNRVRLVKLPKAMTLAEFNRTYPSVIPIAQLAIINGVEEDATLPAGTLVKRVVVE